ncbi:MAG: PilW family protein [Deltaproteobacteria bacterium]|jgi:prepilin-type N-terminal cleavage/methylation domain-containing protein|nr:PilW family protein [Deltaproteobacteria bacterium]
MIAFKLKPEANDKANKRGMSLIELITVIFIGSLLLSMTFLVYTNSSRSMLRQDVILEQLLNLRAGLAGISRDIRGVGNGYAMLGLGQSQPILMYTKDAAGDAVSWYQYPVVDGVTPPYGVAPIYAVDGDQNPDSIFVASLSPDFTAPLGRLSQPLESSSLSIKLSNQLEMPLGVDPKEIIKRHDYLAVVPATGPPILIEVDTDSTNLEEIAIKRMPAGPFPEAVDYAVGSTVYNVKNVVFHSYKIGTQGTTNETFLMLDTLDSENDIMAEGIEDLQAAYCFGDDDPSNLSNYVQDFSGLNTTDNPIKTIRLVLVSRTSRPDPYGKTFNRIPALNHTSLGPPDSYPRRFLETSVQLRNF